MSNHCHDRFKTWISQTTGGAIHGEVVVAGLYDAAQAELSALREELTNQRNHFREQLRGAKNADELHQRLTAAEQRNGDQLALLEKLCGAGFNMLGSSGKKRRVYAYQLEAALREIEQYTKPADSGASE